jgi:carbamate kinase
MSEVTPEYLLGTKAGKAFPGSMGPKIEAAIKFVEESKNPDKVWAAIGDLKDAAKIVKKLEGTIIKRDVKDNVIWRSRPASADANMRPKLSKEPPKYG